MNSSAAPPLADDLLPLKQRAWLRLQKACGWATFVLVGPASVLTMRVIRNNRVTGLAEARRVYRQALASGRPTLICANHLTMVDSAYLHYALAPLWDYALHFRRLSWNVAAIENFEKNPILRVIVFLGKTLPLDRSGDDAHRKGVLNKLRWLVANGEVLTIFPEGTRSRSGRIDPATVTYGIGQILQEHHRPQVLCAYLRGRQQHVATAVPVQGDTLDLKLELIEPTTEQTGLRGVRDLSRQVVNKLAEMEGAWFDAHAPNLTPGGTKPVAQR